MAINYSKSLVLSTPGDSESAKVVVARTQSRGTITLRQLAQHMQDHNTQFSAGVISGILIDACNCVRELVLDGYIVQLDDLGKFYAQIKKQSSSDTWEGFTASNITKAVVAYGKTSESFTDITDDAEWNYVLTKEAEAEAKKEVSTEMTETLGTGSTEDDSSGESDSGV